MEYDNFRTVAWHWLALFYLYAAGVIGLVLYSNPHLYDQEDLKTALAGQQVESPLPIPSPRNQIERGPEGLGGYTDRFTSNREGADASNTARARRFIKVSEHELSTVEGVNMDPANWWTDGDRVFSANEKELFAFNVEGQLQWRFTFHGPDGMTLLKPTSDLRAVYIATSAGKLYCIRKSDGKLIWSLEAAERYYSAPIQMGESLVLAAKPQLSTRLKLVSNNKEATNKEISLIEITKAKGELTKASPWIGALTSDPLTLNLTENNDQFVISQNHLLLAIERATFNTSWQNELPDKTFAYPVVTNEQVFVLTDNSHILSFETKKGKKNWEVDLESAPSTPLTYIPGHHMLAVNMKNGALITLSAKDGEKKWRSAFDAGKIPRVSWASRLNNKVITDLKLKWHFKGWSLMSPCASDRICIFNPENGGQLGVIMTAGELVGQPAYRTDKSMLMLIKQKESYKVSWFMDRPNYKKWRAEQIKEHPESASSLPDVPDDD